MIIENLFFSCWLCCIAIIRSFSLLCIFIWKFLFGDRWNLCECKDNDDDDGIEFWLAMKIFHADFGRRSLSSIGLQCGANGFGCLFTIEVI
jgi:hypothetical protein